MRKPPQQLRCAEPGCDRVRNGSRRKCVRHTDDDLIAAGATCSTDDCSRARRVKGLCQTCYRAARYSQRTCAHPDCDQPGAFGRLCATHRWQHLKDSAAPCTLDNCDRPAVCDGLCMTHYSTRRRLGDPLAARPQATAGAGNTNQYGYRRIRVDGRSRAEHRAVMEQLLGRPLLDHEQVHHRNGQRADNSPGNLELWTVRQPAGQRLDDIISWIMNYPELVASAIADSTRPSARSPALQEPSLPAAVSPASEQIRAAALDLADPTSEVPGQARDVGRLVNGYRRVSFNGRNVALHRLVLEAALGRALSQHETVHHRNGQRDDNRIGNLELWVRRQQPHGQRVADVVAWIVGQYPEQSAAALRGTANTAA